MHFHISVALLEPLLLHKAFLKFLPQLLSPVEINPTPTLYCPGLCMEKHIFLCQDNIYINVILYIFICIFPSVNYMFLIFKFSIVLILPMGTALQYMGSICTYCGFKNPITMFFF